MKIDALAATWAEDEALARPSVLETRRALDRTVLASGSPSDTADLPHIPLGGASGPLDAPDVTLQRVIGEGGMGQVLLAEQRSLGREIAVKRPSVSSLDGSAAYALLHEARVTGSLEHPNVVPVHALGLDADGRPVMLMKRVEGTSLRALIHEPDHPAWQNVSVRHRDATVTFVEILIQVCNALELAHARGILHRDLKPENVMVGAFGEVYLLDWGIAARKGAGGGSPCLVGTPSYMAPEMVEGHADQLDERADVYLLGATLHEILVGEPRHGGTTLAEALTSAIRSEPVSYPPHVARELGELCNAATARDPALRPASAAAFRGRLTDYLQHRASISLADRARERLVELLALPGVAEGSPDALATTEAWRLMTECKFGYLHALEDWPENAEARAGLEEATERMVEREIALENSADARALLAELRGKRPDLEARVAALEERVRARHDEAERLVGLQREMDPTVSARARAIVFGALLIACVVGMSAAMSRSAELSTGELVLLDASIMGVFLVAMGLLRRRLFINAMSTRLTWLIMSMSVFTVGLASLVLLLGGTPRDATALRLFVMSATFTGVAIVSLPSLRWLALLSAAGAFGIPLTGAHWKWVGMTTIVLLLGSTVFLLVTGRVRPRPGDVLS